MKPVNSYISISLFTSLLTILHAFMLKKHSDINRLKELVIK